MDITVHQVDRLAGTVQVPGDKSVAHRALLLGALATGEQIVRGLPASEDVQSTASCLRALGCAVEESESGTVRIRSGEWLDGRSLFAGNSGTTARLISGLVAGIGVHCTIDGDASLRKRPMDRIAEPLSRMGADVRTAEGGRLPIEIRGGGLKGIIHEPAAASAQVKSAVLLAGLNADGETTVIEKFRTRDHTERMLAAMGVPVARRGPAVTVSGGARPKGIPLFVPGDISSAMFFLTAASIVSEAEVRLPGVGINPTRSGALEILERMGAEIIVGPSMDCGGEYMAEIVAGTSPLHGIVIEGSIIPRLIDELPILAVAATQAEGMTAVRGAKELRYKESDRIRTIVECLSRLGASIQEREDGFVIHGPCALKGCIVSSHGDHRIAMAMAVAGLVAEGSTTIEGCEAAAVSYPDFFQDLQALAG